LSRELGHDATKYDLKADRIKRAFAEHLLETNTGLFVDAPGSDHSSLHANAIPLYCGLVDPRNTPRVLDLIRARRLSCGVYVAAFVIEGCFQAGDPDLAWSLINSRDERSWHEMLTHGATTCMEAWGPDQKWNTSWCHPWSSSPVYLVAEYVMGLTPAEPGWKAVRVAPHIPATLDRIEMTIPTPRGPIRGCYERRAGYTLSVPPGTRVIDVTPEDMDLRMQGAP
jgi:hypothetical protein